MKQEVTAKVTAMIATTIGVTPGELAGRDSLVDKYGIESLDILDISFRVNKEFGVKLYRGDFLRKATEALGTAMLEDGKLTAFAVDLLRRRLPEAAENPLLVPGAPRNVLIRLYCADSWVRQIIELREANETSGEAYLDAWLAGYGQELKVA